MCARQSSKQTSQSFSSVTAMANSQYEYVRLFESSDHAMPDCWMVVRIDGRGFTKFCQKHGFEKPNDIRGLNLMNRAATQVMRSFTDIVIAYGISDEFSFVFHPSTQLYRRRQSKILSSVVSLFTAQYIHNWKKFFTFEMQEPPSFDARLVLYPNVKTIRDYLSWRQVDAHINNLYNTLFWALVTKKGLTNVEVQIILKDTNSAQKNEILFSEFAINYNDEPAQYRKGSILVWKQISDSVVSGRETSYDIDECNDVAKVLEDEHYRQSSTPLSNDNQRSYVHPKRDVVVLHEDLISPSFYDRHPYIIPYMSFTDQRKFAKSEQKKQRMLNKQWESRRQQDIVDSQTGDAL